MAAGAYDVVIIGAGVAGCCATLSLPRGARALLVDKGGTSAGRCCGGLLTPDGQDVLARLGFSLPGWVRVEPQPGTVHVRDLDSGREQTYRRKYVNLDRDAFDAWLLGLARERVEFRPHLRFAGIRGEAGVLRIRLLGGGREETVSAGLVVGADGARSAVRRAAFPDSRAPSTMFALQVRISAERPPEEHEVLFSSRHTDFYAWAIPKPGEVLVGSAFSVWPARRQFDTLLGVLRETLHLRGPVLARSSRYLTRPRRVSELCSGEGRVLLAGEAAGLVSPSSGEGLSFALESGVWVGRAAGTASPIEVYRRSFRRAALRVGLKFLKARVVFAPSLRRLALLLPWCP